MIHWFIKRMRKSMLLSVMPVMPVMGLVFILLNTAGSTQSSEDVENSDGELGETSEEVLSVINPADPADVYIQWDMPKSATTEGQYDSIHSDWFLGAYKSVSECGSKGVSANETLDVVLDRAILTNDVVFAVHYLHEPDSGLYVEILDVNGNVVLEDLCGNLITGSEADVVLSLDMPLASYPDASVIQLRCGGGIVVESRLYIEGYENRLIPVQEFGDSEPEYNKAVNNSGAVAGIYSAVAQIADSQAWASSEEALAPNQKARASAAATWETDIIYVDQMIGDDRFGGRSSVVSGQDGPKKTIWSGLSAAEDKSTLIIKSGAYHENLDIKDRDVNVVIEGNVKL